MDINEALPTFIEESRELLDAMESALLSLDAASVDGEAINAIFRAAHTIKGSSGLFGLDHVVAFTHVAESLLDEVRSGAVQIDAPLVAVLLASADHLRSLIEAIAGGNVLPDPALEAAAEPLLARLRERMGVTTALALADITDITDILDAPAALESSAATPAAGADIWHLSLRFGPEVLRDGMDPMSFIRYLNTVGRVVRIATVADALPPAAEMDPERCYLGFEIALQSTADKAAIENVFEFVLDSCTLHILPPASRIEAFVALIAALPESPPRLGEMLVHCGTVTAHELQAALAAQAQAAEVPQKPIGRILVEQGRVEPAVVQAALEKQHRASEARGRESQTVRVDADKLDRLIDLVGELITASARSGAAAQRIRDAELVEAQSMLDGLVQEVRDSALQLRTVRIGATFGRFQRVVHDVSREIGKDIELVVLGEETELDKTVVEKIGDPLTHLVRNAMDHGIEAPADRLAAGKPPRGTLTLNAFHDSGRIVIEVSDDGRGLNRERILAKGIERGLVEAGKTLGDADICNLIFEPGFSTAEQVTNLSGRGVGMDVVKRNITALRGTVEVTSRAGFGTKVTVRLPLTLAIIDGFQVGVGASVFVLPLDTVDECVEYRPDAADEQDYTDLRGQVLPLIRLRRQFDLGGAPGARQNIVVLRHGAQKVGLVVDRLLGEAQTVIKPLSKVFTQVKGISGSSIRGSGEVSLILDIPALIRQADAQGSRKPQAAAAPSA